MEEKILHEVKIVETEDGFRIEIKGDKEQIREFLKHRGAAFGMGMPGMGMPPGPMGFMRHRRHRHEHGHRHGHGPFGHFAKMWTSGPWGWDEEEDEREEPRQRGPEADRGSDNPRV